MNKKIKSIDLYRSDKIAEMNGTHTINVSPAMAEKWLVLNQANRPLTDTHVSRFAETMRRDQWTLNGQPIIFSEEGTLLDGQHRLHAVLESKKSVDFDVRFGVKTEAMVTIDEGKKRSSGDVLFMMGFKNHTTTAAAARMVMRYQDNLKALEGGKDAPNNIEVLEWCRNNPHIEQVVEWAQKYYMKMRGNTPLTGSKIAAYKFICDEIDKSLSDDFYYRLVTGAGLEIDSVMFMLRDRLMSGKNNPEINLRPSYITGLLATAWNHERNGRTPKRLLYSEERGEVVRFE